MIEIIGDFWEVWREYDIICIPTNGMVSSGGRAIMGKGIALQARKVFPKLDKSLGIKITSEGIKFCKIHSVEVRDTRNLVKNVDVYAFPTKIHWKNKSSLELIKTSTEELRELLEALPSNVKVLLPRPGCRAGKLNWENVKLILQDKLDDRVYVIEKR